jgi:hypothetical protein
MMVLTVFQEPDASQTPLKMQIRFTLHRLNHADQNPTPAIKSPQEMDKTSRDLFKLKMDLRNASHQASEALHSHDETE